MQQRDAVAAAAAYYHGPDAVVTPSGFRISLDARGAGLMSQTEGAPPPMAAVGDPPEGAESWCRGAVPWWQSSEGCARLRR